eukprot:NODE_47_length_32105_cov_1.240892.p29 type:complete len:105 gc:universal NODE_47_length_32105_cov_1.240892:12969-13283(+)
MIWSIVFAIDQLSLFCNSNYVQLVKNKPQIIDNYQLNLQGNRIHILNQQPSTSCFGQCHQKSSIHVNFKNGLYWNMDSFYKGFISNGPIKLSNCGIIQNQMDLF